MRIAELWPDVRRVIVLAIPVALAELGWMAMTVVDTIMISPLGPVAIGAIGIGNSAFYSFAIFGMGLLLGLDTLVSQAFGAGDRGDCHHSLSQGLHLAVFFTIPLMLLFAFMPPVFYALGINAEVSGRAGSFLITLSFSTLPLLLYGALRRYLQGIGHVRPVMFTLISANLINWFFNWLLILGHWGFPALGVVGSALSTCLARVYMALLLAGFIWWFERKTTAGFRAIFRPPDWTRIHRLIRIGLPAATQILLEIGAFGAAAILAGRLSPISLASHQIALNCAAVTFMVPLGVSSAAAVAVGQAIGRGEPALARRNGFIAIGLACAFMTCAALAFLVIPGPILRVYTNNAGILSIGTGLLAIAALFQLFDGIQTVATGALRGLGNTRTAMLVNLGGYWLLGLPIGYMLCFRQGFGIYGLWWGLTLALIAIALILLYSWQGQSRCPQPVCEAARVHSA
ncbi:MAG: MATE family efflux transporter [Acidobacteriaceae bacterium]|nr:MATE family efflux transporter [Acidobacteriaceae bacterium]MBV9502626.1 MATE family efflux transporter [Acidobacteriaceae bacterium]